MSSTRALAPRMIGRQAQLQELEEQLRQARIGSCRLVLVAGEAGVGKTRLLRAFLESARALDGVEILQGYCFEEQPPAAYGPFIGALRAFMRAHGAEPVIAAAGPLSTDLLPLFPELGLPAPVAVADPQAQKQRLFEALSRALRPQDATRCRILVLEDLHWVDQTSLELLRYLLRAGEGEPLLLLATCRTDDLHRRHPLGRLLAQLTRDRVLHEVQVPPLPRDDLARMLEATLQRPLPAAFVAEMADRTGGNPYFVEELLSALLDQGPIDAALQAAREGLEGTQLTIPRSVKESIRGRTADLDAATAEVLHHAAVVGRNFDFDILLQLTGLDDAALLRAVEELVERQIVEEERGAQEDRYRFRHALSREAIYDDLLGRDRRRRHRMALQALEQMHKSDPEAVVDQLAYHSARAQDRTRAARYARLAGDRSMRIYAFREAVGHYQAALRALQTDDPGERAALLRNMGDAAFPLGDAALYERCWREALPLFEQAGDRRQAALLYNDLAQCEKDREDHVAALAHLQTAAALLEAEEPGVELAEIYGHIANIYCNMGRSQECLDWADKSERLGEALGETEIAADALMYRGRTLRDLGDPQAALVAMERFLAVTREADLGPSLLAGCFHLGWTCWMLGEFRRAIAVLRTGIGEAERYGWKQRIEGDCGGHLAYAEMEVGHWQEAEAALSMTLQAAADGHPWARRVAVPVRGELWLRQGRLQEALQVLEESQRDYQAGATLLQGVWPVLALARLALGDRDGALAAADTAVQRWRERSSPAAHERTLACAVEVYVAAGRADAARELLGDLADFADRAGSPAARAYRATAAGQIAAQERRHLDAALEFERAAEIWQAQGATYLEAQARRLRAGSLLGAGDPDLRATARDQLVTAQAICAALGAELELEAIAGVMRRYGLSAPAAHAADPHSGQLTPREREVIALIAQGCSNRAIAERLVISEKTAENHVGNILGKLGLASRAQAAAYAVEHGLAPTAAR